MPFLDGFFPYGIVISYEAKMPIKGASLTRQPLYERPWGGLLCIKVNMEKRIEAKESRTAQMTKEMRGYLIPIFCALLAVETTFLRLHWAAHEL